MRTDLLSLPSVECVDLFAELAQYVATVTVINTATIIIVHALHVHTV